MGSEEILHDAWQGCPALCSYPFCIAGSGHGFAAQTGMHLQDGMYVVGVDDPQIADFLASDARFTVYSMDSPVLLKNQNAFDLIVVKGTVYSSATDKGKAAQKTLERDYSKYVNSIYNTETDLFAAYPLWIDTQSVKSELNFLATQSGQYISANPQDRS